jgi:poly(3-hydroxybutyrate) depolymerase
VYAGRGSDNGHAESFTHFSSPSYNPDMLVVYPQGTIDPTGEDVWEGDPNADVDDVGFTRELLDSILATYAVDENRIYASGMSNGGGFVANHLACDADASKRFAAFGAVSAAYYQFRDTSRRSCKPESVKINCNNGGNKIPLIDIHGGRDQTIDYSGGYRRGACLPSVPHFVTSWAERNGMEASNQTSQAYNGDAVHYSFGNGEAAGMVQSYYVPTMGHVWASGSNGEVLKATDVLMDFFSEWTVKKRESAATTLPDTSGSYRSLPDAWSLVQVSMVALAFIRVF